MNLGSLGLHTHQHTIDVLCRLHRSRWFLTGVYSYLYSFPLPRLYPRTTHLDPWCRERLHTRLAWSWWGPTYQLLLSNCMRFVSIFDTFCSCWNTSFPWGIVSLSAAKDIVAQSQGMRIFSISSTCFAYSKLSLSTCHSGLGGFSNPKRTFSVPSLMAYLLLVSTYSGCNNISILKLWWLGFIEIPARNI